MKNENDIDYGDLCWKLTDKLNAAWRKVNNKSDYEFKYTFEFMPANSAYLYAEGVVAQIVEHDCLMPVVASNTGILTGCHTAEEAFKSMIENYLELIKRDQMIGLDDIDYPKTLEEIAA